MKIPKLDIIIVIKGVFRVYNNNCCICTLLVDFACLHLQVDLKYFLLKYSSFLNTLSLINIQVQ